MSRETEDQRAKRIQREQIAMRNPGVSKIKGYDWGKHAKKAQKISEKKKPPLFVEIWQALPARWRWLVYGFLLGTFFGFLGVSALMPDMGFLIIVPQLVCMLCGMVLGTLIDKKDEV